MVCLDTSILAAQIRKEERALEKLKRETDRRGKVSTTVINLCELYAGAYASMDLIKAGEGSEASILPRGIRTEPRCEQKVW